jgi:hypothetical protein
MRTCIPRRIRTVLALTSGGPVIAGSVLLAGCEGPVLAPPSGAPELVVPGNATWNLADVTLPFRATSGSAGPGVLIPPGEQGAADRCTELGLLTLRGSVAGKATHLGRFTGTAENCTQPPIPGPVDAVAGEFEAVGANGDALRGTYSGRQEAVDPVTGDASFRVTLEVTGGTGRFAAATGRLEEVGVINFFTGSMASEIRGWIRYAISGP